MPATREQVRHAFVETLLKHIRQDAFPGTTMMSSVERHADSEQAAAYVAILLDKLASTRYPSADFMNRVGSLVP